MEFYGMNITIEYIDDGRIQVVLHDVQRQLIFTPDVSLATIREAIIGELLPNLTDVMLRIAESRA
jgi:hypothetical protein